MNSFEQAVTTPNWHRYAFYANGKLIELANNPYFKSRKITYWRSRGFEITVIDREKQSSMEVTA